MNHETMHDPMGRQNLPLRRLFPRAAEVLALAGVGLGVGFGAYEATATEVLTPADRLPFLGPAIGALLMSLLMLWARDSRLTEL